MGRGWCVGSEPADLRLLRLLGPGGQLGAAHRGELVCVLGVPVRVGGGRVGLVNHFQQQNNLFKAHTAP